MFAVAAAVAGPSSRAPNLPEAITVSDTDALKLAFKDEAFAKHLSEVSGVSSFLDATRRVRDTALHASVSRLSLEGTGKHPIEVYLDTVDRLATFVQDVDTLPEDETTWSKTDIESLKRTVVELSDKL